MKLPGSTLIPCRNQIAPAEATRLATIFSVTLIIPPRTRSSEQGQVRSGPLSVGLSQSYFNEQLMSLLSPANWFCRGCYARTRWRRLGDFCTHLASLRYSSPLRSRSSERRFGTHCPLANQTGQSNHTHHSLYLYRAQGRLCTHPLTWGPPVFLWIPADRNKYRPTQFL
jgi:hypothetical protein